MVHEQMARFLGGLRRDAPHPMAVLVASVGAFSAFPSRIERYFGSKEAHGGVVPSDRQNADPRCDGV